MIPLRHLDLFSGIGGFALAARWTGQIETIAFCENDPFCQHILRRHWPHVPLFDDIHTLTKQALHQQGIEHIDLLTGGFPCQPFSTAGKRRGTADDRHLWPQMLRVIAQVRPRWVVGENVVGLLHLALDECLFDLEAQGYEAWTVVLPACALNAPHRRERVFLLAHADEKRHPCRSEEHPAKGKKQHEPADRCLALADADGLLRRRPPQGTKGGTETPGAAARSGTDARAAAWNPQSRVGGAVDGVSERLDTPAVNYSEQPSERAPSLPPWEGDWERGVARTAPGIKHRMARLRALGNAVVPQVVTVLLQAILEQERS